MIRTVNDLLQRLGLFERAIFLPAQRSTKRLTEEQRPEILFLTCSDPRIMPDLLFQSQPGEIFIARNPGNIVPPDGSGPDATVATREFAVCALNVRAIVICGHSNCGAMKALVHPEKLVNMPKSLTFCALRSFLQHTRPPAPPGGLDRSADCHRCNQPIRIDRSTRHGSRKSTGGSSVREPRELGGPGQSGASLLAQIPTSALAAVLVLAGMKLIDVVPIQRLRQYGKMPSVIYGSTIAGIVELDLLKGVLIGVTLTLATLVYQASRLGARPRTGPL